MSQSKIFFARPWCLLWFQHKCPLCFVTWPCLNDLICCFSVFPRDWFPVRSCVCDGLLRKTSRKYYERVSGNQKIESFLVGRRNAVAAHQRFQKLIFMLCAVLPTSKIPTSQKVKTQICLFKLKASCTRGAEKNTFKTSWTLKIATFPWTVRDHWDAIRRKEETPRKQLEYGFNVQLNPLQISTKRHITICISCMRMHRLIIPGCFQKPCV